MHCEKGLAFLTNKYFIETKFVCRVSVCIDFQQTACQVNGVTEQIVEL